MKEFEIWIEGYAATGEHSTASYIGKVVGETFEDACRNFVYQDDIHAEWGGITIPCKGEKLKLDLNEDGSFRYKRPSIWACRLFDNEADARKSFG